MREVPMKLLVTLLSLLCCAVAVGAEDHSQHQQGDGACDAFPWDMSRELDLLRATPIAVNALTMIDGEAIYSPLDRRLDLTLRPAADVKLLAEPGRSHGADTYAGLLKLRLPRASTYRISSDQRLWIDVIGPDGVVKSTKFAMQPGCDKLHKSVAFRLEPDIDYWIQISGGPTPNPILLITLDR
jgi:hypothetical protein